MNYSNSEKDSQKAEKIRRQYLDRESNKIEQLKALDGKVKLPGTVVASVVGVIGALTMGGGMSLIMVNSSMATGLLLGIPGMILGLLAYPLYKVITSGRRKKFAPKILALSEDITKN